MDFWIEISQNRNYKTVSVNIEASKIGTDLNPGTLRGWRAWKAFAKAVNT